MLFNIVRANEILKVMTTLSRFPDIELIAAFLTGAIKVMQDLELLRSIKRYTL